jgi:hypothetical protein
MIKEIKPAGEVVREIWEEYGAAMQQLKMNN